MAQKVQFIAALVSEPDLIILDEPFSGLDPVSVHTMKAIILELKAQGRTIIFSNPSDGLGPKSSATASA